eukprot:EG_transcript_3864
MLPPPGRAGAGPPPRLCGALLGCIVTLLAVLSLWHPTSGPGVLSLFIHEPLPRTPHPLLGRPQVPGPPARRRGAALNAVQWPWEGLPTAPTLEMGEDPAAGSNWRYTDFLQAVEAHQVRSVQFDVRVGPFDELPQAGPQDSLAVRTVEGREVHVQLPPYDGSLTTFLVDNNVDIFVQDPAPKILFFLFVRLAIIGVVIAACSYFVQLALDGLPRYLVVEPVQDTGVKFADVAGVGDAAVELQEVVDFLRDPGKYTSLGARIPRGVLLSGPPGTGKTLLARAVAGEAGVPFFAVSASSFIEQVVGGGAARLRDLFAKARAAAPCIVFLDEVDAIGRQRSTDGAVGGGMGEEEQTINQLLTEMDGFEGESGVIILAATNRPDVLDSALTRPGRFDRRVTVALPDLRGRRQILAVHARGKPLAPDVDLDTLAQRCPGFSGADLANVLNEAAILAAQRGRPVIGGAEVAQALERVLAGPEKVDAVMSAEKRRLVAYHEAGHALVGTLMPERDAVARVTIIPRGSAGGLTFFTPNEQRMASGLYSRQYLETQLAVALGGRVAEELVFGAEAVTTGAANDLQQVTRIARLMVTQMGFSDRLGQVAITMQEGTDVMGRPATAPMAVSQATVALVDAEVQALVATAYRRAKDLVQTHSAALHALAGALLARESLSGEEVAALVAEAGGTPYLKPDAPSVPLPYLRP